MSYNVIPSTDTDQSKSGAENKKKKTEARTPHQPYLGPAQSATSLTYSQHLIRISPTPEKSFAGVLHGLAAASGPTSPRHSFPFLRVIMET